MRLIVHSLITLITSLRRKIMFTERGQLVLNIVFYYLSKRSQILFKFFKFVYHVPTLIKCIFILMGGIWVMP